MCLDVVLFVLIVVGILCAFWTWISVSFPRLGKFLAVMSSNIFFLCFFFKKKKAINFSLLFIFHHSAPEFFEHLSDHDLELYQIDCLTPLHLIIIIIIIIIFGVLSGSFIWNIFLCCLILPNLLFSFLCIWWVG